MKRIFQIICVVALLAACNPVDPSDPGGNKPPVPEEYTVSGTVSGSDGSPLEGVVVSDGLNCTVTGSDGKYYLNADLADTDYVFVSTPSGWAAPVQDGLAVFWKFLKDCKAGTDGKYGGVDFKLNKIQDPSRFTMLIFADPQPRSRSAGYDKMAYHSLDCCDDMYRDMKDLISPVKGRPVYGMGLGDIVHRDLKLLPAYKNGLATTGMATYNVIGNHDHDVSLPDDRTSCKTFESYMGPCNYSFNLGGIHFLVLDDMIAPDESTGRARDNCDTGLTDRIWQWMQNDLAKVPRESTVMVCAHSPMFHLQGGGERKGKLLADCRSLLSKYAKVYAWAGHTHTTCNYVDTSNPVIETHTLTRVTGALWTNEFLGANGTPRGYVVLDCDGGEVSWYFKPVFWQTGKYDSSHGGSGKKPDYRWRDWDYDASGRAILKSNGKPLDEKYQMQLYAPGVYGDKYLYANVFMWDELWKAPVFTSDGVPAAMKRVTTKDYRYSYSDWDITLFYKNNNSYLANEFNPDLNNCDSMFRVYVDSEHGSGTVSVTDRFGNTYSSTITW